MPEGESRRAVNAMLHQRGLPFGILITAILIITDSGTINAYPRTGEFQSAYRENASSSMNTEYIIYRRAYNLYRLKITRIRREERLSLTPN